MKKLFSLLFSALIIIAMTQCKKDAGLAGETPVSGGEVYLTVNADNGSGSKIDITHASGSNILGAAWSTGDKLFVVGATSGYLGYVTLTEGDGTAIGKFGGYLPDFDSQVLRFYHLGKTAAAPDAGAETLLLDFSNQDGTMETIEDRLLIYSGCTAEAVSSAITITVSMSSMISIAYFDMSVSSGDVYLYGNNVYKKAELNLKTGTFNLNLENNVATQESAIHVGKQLFDAYVALLPSNGVAMNFANGSKIKSFGGTDIASAMLYCGSDGSAIPVWPHNNTVEGALKGLFAVSDTKKVMFSKGNLQYQASTQTWRFATNQYDYIGVANSNISSSNSGWIDLFGWGTSGQNTGAIAYQPYSTSTTDSDYYPGGSATSNLTYDNKADWGYNAISNGGNATMQWRTLSGCSIGELYAKADEWYYLCNTRTNASSKRGWACVNNINGIVILPGSWTQPSGLSFTPNSSGFTTNKYTGSEWTLMENAGAVFLPAAGDRNGTHVFHVGSYGYYWSSSSDKEDVYILYFGNSFVFTNIYGFRYDGYSVRLVQDL